jgi:hypothetical protein
VCRSEIFLDFRPLTSKGNPGREPVIPGTLKSMMLQLECNDLIVNQAWIDNQKTGSSERRTFVLEDPADGTILATLPISVRWRPRQSSTPRTGPFSSWRRLLDKERA